MTYKWYQDVVIRRHSVKTQNADTKCSDTKTYCRSIFKTFNPIIKSIVMLEQTDVHIDMMNDDDDVSPNINVVQ